MTWQQVGSYDLIFRSHKCEACPVAYVRYVYFLSNSQGDLLLVGECCAKKLIGHAPTRSTSGSEARVRSISQAISEVTRDIGKVASDISKSRATKQAAIAQAEQIKGDIAGTIRAIAAFKAGTSRDSESTSDERRAAELSYATATARNGAARNRRDYADKKLRDFENDSREQLREQRASNERRIAESREQLRAMQRAASDIERAIKREAATIRKLKSALKKPVWHDGRCKFGGMTLHVQKHYFSDLVYFWINRKPPKYSMFYRADLRESWPHGYAATIDEAQRLAILAAVGKLAGDPFDGLAKLSAPDFLPE